MLDVEQAGYVLDPQIREFLAAPGSDAAPSPSLAISQARLLYRESRLRLQGASEAMAAVDSITIDGTGDGLVLRLYRPFSLSAVPLTAPLPCLVFFHGGGFVLGDLESHDPLCRALAYQGQCAVASVDYRLAPEHRFPAAVDDAIAAVKGLVLRARELQLDPVRFAVGGDSAGGALAAVAAIGLRQTPVNLALQLLLYPITDMTHDMASHHRLAEGYGLTREKLLWFRSRYLVSADQALDWRASPLRAASHAGLPPACIVTAGFDPLRDEGRAYAERLHAAKVPVMYECFGGMVHGFMLMPEVVAAARHAIYRAGQALRATFSGVSLAVAPLRQHRAAEE